MTRYTPNGSPVRAYNEITEMSSGDKEDWSDYVVTNYPKAKELNTHSATKSYNCHAYAWHISEGGDNVWIGYYSWQTADEDVYWTDGSYLNQSVETGAEKISYYNGNHSAIQTSTGGIYKSKWGDGPLMQHARNYGPSIYNMNQRRYYVRPYILGSSAVCTSNSAFTLHNRPSGSSVTWTKSNNLSYVSGQYTSTYTVKALNSSASGVGWVQAQISSNNLNSTIVRLEFWVGPPSVNEMIFSNTFGEEEYLCTSHSGNEVSWSFPHEDNYWDVRVSNINGTQVLYTQRTRGTSADLDYSALSPGFYLVGISGKNECAGQGEWNDTEVMWMDCSQGGEGGEEGMYFLELAPNPVNNKTEIEVLRSDNQPIGDNIIWELEIYDLGMKLKSKSNKIYGKKQKISAQSWKEGIYVIRAYINDEIVTKKFIKK